MFINKKNLFELISIHCMNTLFNSYMYSYLSYTNYYYLLYILIINQYSYLSINPYSYIISYYNSYSKTYQLSSHLHSYYLNISY
jgi:hypothetical protein